MTYRFKTPVFIFKFFNLGSIFDSHRFSYKFTDPDIEFVLLRNVSEVKGRVLKRRAGLPGLKALDRQPDHLSNSRYRLKNF